MRAEKPKSTRLKKHRWCFHDLHSGRGFQPRFSLTLPSPSASSSWQRRVSCVTADSSVRFSECWLPFYLRNIINIDPVYRLVQTWTNKQDWSCGLARISQYDTYHNRGATTCVCVCLESLLVCMWMQIIPVITESISATEHQTPWFFLYLF